MKKKEFEKVMWGSSAAWQAKHYLCGLDPGLWMVGDAWQAVKLFTHNEQLKLWCMVPENIRKERIDLVNRRNSEYNRDFFDSRNSDMPRNILNDLQQVTCFPGKGLTNLLHTVLDLQLDQITFLKRTFFENGGNLTEKDFDDFAAQLRDPLTRGNAWVDTDHHPLWIWALSKYFRDCDCNAGHFMASLDMNVFRRFVNRHVYLGGTFFCIEFSPTFKRCSSYTLSNFQSRILSGMTLRDITALASVNKNFRSTVWLHLLHCAPTRYEVPKTETFVWLCAMHRLRIRIPLDIRKMIARLSECHPGEVRIFWDN